MAERGCPECVMDLIRFKREVRLPRFTMRVGEEWMARRRKMSLDGYEIDGGLAPPDSFEVLVLGAAVACGCSCRGLRDG